MVLFDEAEVEEVAGRLLPVVSRGDVANGSVDSDGSDVEAFHHLIHLQPVVVGLDCQSAPHFGILLQQERIECECRTIRSQEKKPQILKISDPKD